MKNAIKIFFLSAIILFVVADLSGQTKSKYTPQEYIDHIIKKDPNFQNAVVGIYATDQNGKTIAEWNSNLPLLTASTLKTITTGLALVYLGEDFRFETKLAYNGEIKDGVLHGDLFIIGGADPTLGSKDDVAFSVDSIFGIWKDAIKSLGIHKIEGAIVVDDTFLEREVIPTSWSWGNIGYYYGSAPSGLPFHEDYQSVKLIPSKNVGDKVKILVEYPQIPDFHYVNQLITGEAKSGDWSEYYVSDLARVGKFTGSVPCDRDTIKTTISNKYAYLSCGAEFRDFLIAHSIEIKNDIYSIDQKELIDPKDLKTIITTYSPELWQIVKVTNRISNNFYAETIYKTIAKAYSGVGSYSAASKVASRLLDSLNVSRIGYTQDDGSGLSRQNYISPKFFVRFYEMMARQPQFQKYIESFPYSGVGTLKNVMKGKKFSPTIAKRVHAKSGSLSSVKTYAGYVYGGKKTGLIKFAILVNNYSSPTSSIQKHLEGFMYALAQTE